MTHPPSGPSTPTPPPGPKLPRLGEVLRDAERYIAQALSVLDRDVDPASEPTILAWPAISEVRVHDVLLSKVAADLQAAVAGLGKVAAMDLPPAGSAVTYPAIPDADPAPAFPGEHTILIPRLSVLFDRNRGRHRHEPDRPGAPGLPPRPIDYPQPRAAG
jgi:hypothetical protein